LGLFNRHAKEGKLSSEAFFRCCSELLPETKVNHQQLAIRMHLQNLYGVFDVDGSGDVDADELLSGFYLLCKATTVNKMGLGFYLVDTDCDNVVSKAELFRFFLSVFMVMVSMAEQTKALPTATLDAIIVKAATTQTEAFFKRAKCSDPNAITFEEYQHVFLTDPQCISWLAIFDTDRPQSAVTSSKSSASSSSSSNSALLDTKQAAAAPVPNSVTVSVQNGERTVTMSAENPTVELLRTRGGLGSISSTQVLAALESLAKSDKGLDRTGFFACLDMLLHVSTMPALDQQRLQFTGNLLFDLFDGDADGYASVPEVLLGLSTFCGGDSMDKLFVSFQHFDQDDSGRLSAEELFRYVRSLVACLLSCDASLHGKKSAAALRVLVDREARQLVTQAFAAVECKLEDGMAFDDFAVVCVQNPQLVPWVTVLDCVAFEQDGNSSSSSGNASAASQSQFQEVKSTADLKQPSALYSIEQVRAGLRAIRLLGFDKIAPSKLIRTFKQCAGKAKSLSEQQFTTAIRKLLPLAGLTEEQRVFLHADLSNLFMVFDADDSGRVDTHEFLSALLLLCSGGDESERSVESKLKLSFYLFDRDSKGSISLEETQLFLRSYLGAVVALSRQAVGRTVTQDEIDGPVTHSAHRAAAAIFASLDANNDDAIRYDEFESVAKTGAPWLACLFLE
jgi:Ca2+-binding EF-hand superfamily protein